MFKSGTMHEVQELKDEYTDDATLLLDESKKANNQRREIRDRAMVNGFEELFGTVTKGARKILKYYKAKFSDFNSSDLSEMESLFTDEVLEVSEIQQLRHAATGLYNVIQTCNNFGFSNTKRMTHPTELNEGWYAAKGCGPRAVWALVTKKIKSTNENWNISSGGVKAIQRETNPQYWGTIPENITAALKVFGKYGHPKVQSFASSSKYIECVKGNIPCITKLAISWSGQHYVCITQANRDAQGHVISFDTNDGYTIPIKYLQKIGDIGVVGKKMVWTI